MESKLILHAGARKVALAELAHLEEPQGMGRRHWPVAHHLIVELLREKADKAGLRFVKEQHALSAGNETYFGVFDLAMGNGDHTVSIGLRNNHTRRFSGAMCYGQRVFVCDNLAFHGDHEVFRRHTRNILADLGGQVEGALGKVREFHEKNERRVLVYSATDLHGHNLPVLCRQLVKAESVPAGKWPEVLTEWDSPDKYGPTAWGFYNAITQILTPRGEAAVTPRYADRTAELTKVFDEFAGLN